MEKLTKKQLIAALPGTAFIAAIWNRPLADIIDAVENTKELPVIYDVKNVVIRSKHIDVIKTDGTTSRRDFVGKNEYYRHGDLLIHHQIEEGGATCTLLNK